MNESPQGQSAASKAGVPRWRELIKRTIKDAGDDNLGMLAAAVGFYAFLAFVPLLGAVVLIYGLVAQPQDIARHVHALFRILPPDAAKLVSQQMISVTKASTGKSGLGLAFALLLTLYGAMKGAGAIVTALNMVHDETEARSWARTYGLGLAITAGVALLGAVGMLAIGALAFLKALIPTQSSAVITLIRAGFWLAAAVAACGIVALIYRYAPNRDAVGWRLVLPGAIMTTVGWLAMTLAFGFYVANLGHYNATYGSLGAVVVLLIWLYLSAYILLAGAELNSTIEQQAGQDQPGPAREEP